jgi:hypothetical protein
MSEIPPSEARIQADLWAWLNNTYLIRHRCIAFHIPNGGARDAREGASLKAQGVVPGVADLFIGANGKSLFLEMKTQTGTQSPNQRDWGNRAMLQGFRYEVVRSVQEAKAIITHFLIECGVV